MVGEGERVRTVHVITPGDHFSPRTGSAVATVVHGLCSHAGPDVRSAVCVAAGTYPDRYASAEIYEYDEAAPLRLPARLSPTLVDAAAARAGAPRLLARRRLSPTVRDQSAWPSSVIFGHNAPQLVRLVDTDRHHPFLYAHNDVLRTYRPGEAGRALDRAAGIICVSHYLARQTLQHLPARLHDRVRVVHNGVDAQLFRRTDPVGTSALLRVVFVGRMVRDKGADVLVEAMHLLQRDDVALTVVGSRGFSATDPPTEFERALRDRAASLGDRVSFRPFLPRSQVARLLGSSDVLVVPSRWAEPFALTVREGQASGMAVVASEVGGIPEALGGAGVMVPPDDPEALADVLTVLTQDRQRLRALGTTARSFAETHDWSASAAALADTVTELVG